MTNTCVQYKKNKPSLGIPMNLLGYKPTVFFV